MKICNSRGQALVEFALSFPILMLLMIGAVELGWLFNSYITVTGATRDAARNGTQLTNGAVCGLITGEMNRGSGAKKVTITRTMFGSSANQSVDTLSVAEGTSTCTCADGIVTGTVSGHKVVTATSDRYMQVDLEYSSNLLLGFQLPAFPQTFALTSRARFPVAPFITAFNLTASC